MSSYLNEHPGGDDVLIAATGMKPKACSFSHLSAVLSNWIFLHVINCHVCCMEIISLTWHDEHLLFVKGKMPLTSLRMLGIAKVPGNSWRNSALGS